MRHLIASFTTHVQMSAHTPPPAQPLPPGIQCRSDSVGNASIQVSVILLKCRVSMQTSSCSGAPSLAWSHQDGDQVGTCVIERRRKVVQGSCTLWITLDY
jgi:hypothetical protein